MIELQASAPLPTPTRAEGDIATTRAVDLQATAAAASGEHTTRCSLSARTGQKHGAACVKSAQPEQRRERERERELEREHEWRREQLKQQKLDQEGP